MKYTAEEEFARIIGAIYSDTSFIPDPFTLANYNKLNAITSYFRGNPGSFIDFCEIESEPEVHALRCAVSKWKDFKSYIELFKHAFNVPDLPELWALQMHVKSIVEFVQWEHYISVKRHAFKAAGVSEANFTSFEDYSNFRGYLECAEIQRKKMLDGFISKCGPGPGAMKLMNILKN